MSNNRLVRDSNQAKLGGNRKNQNKTGQDAQPEGRVELTNDNALPFIAKFVNGVYIEMQKLNKQLEEMKKSG